MDNITYIKQNDFKIYVRIDKSFQDVKIVNQVISGDEYEIAELASMIPEKPKVILDIGGHIGTFGLLAKRYWPDARLLAVEPIAENAELYRKNLKANGFRGHIIEAALNYNPNKTILVLNPRTTGGAFLTDKITADKYIYQQHREFNKKTKCDIPFMTIEEILDKFKIEIIDLCKWDCEGCEADAFFGMKDETTRKFRYMVGECHIPSETEKYLTSNISPCTCKQFWSRLKKKFNHLYWNYNHIDRGPNSPLVNFQAWPKEIKNECNAVGIENEGWRQPTKQLS